MSPTVVASCEGPGKRKHAVKPNKTSNRRIFTSVGKVVRRVVTELSTFGHDLDQTQVSQATVRRVPELEALKGLRPTFSAHVRWCKPVALGF
jgi:hypothetical protein